LSNAFITKLCRYAPLGDNEIAALEKLSRNPRRWASGRDLIREGQRPEIVFMLLEGWAYRYKILKDGSRHILAYLVPGDVCDIHIFMLDEMDHSIGLLSDALVVEIPPKDLMAAMEKYPAIQRALWWATLVDEATLREWLVNIGQRDSFERIAHLFCEMWLRMQAIGLVNEDESFDLPLTQVEIGDTMGLTAVHVNRTLQRLRREELITLDNARLTILDPKRLAAVSGFRPNYLHRGTEPLEKRLRERLGAPV